MRLTDRNTRYDQESGAFIVQQSDEMKQLRQVLLRLQSIETKLDSLIQGSGISDGTEMEDK